MLRTLPKLGSGAGSLARRQLDGPVRLSEAHGQRKSLSRAQLERGVVRMSDLRLQASDGRLGLDVVV